MNSTRAMRRLALVASGSALVGIGIAAAGGLGATVVTGFTAERVTAPLAPTTSVAPSFAPSNPVDCADPNNVVNCQSPPVDSPLVVGTAAPGSPFRD